MRIRRRNKMEKDCALNEILFFQSKMKLILEKEELKILNKIDNFEENKELIEFHKKKDFLEKLIEERIKKVNKEEEKSNLDETNLECIFTYEVMKDPHITRSGNSYEKEQLLWYIRKDNRDPMTRKPIKPTEIYPNKALRKAIEYHKAPMLTE